MKKNIRKDLALNNVTSWRASHQSETSCEKYALITKLIDWLNGIVSAKVDKCWGMSTKNGNFDFLMVCLKPFFIIVIPSLWQYNFLHVGMDKDFSFLFQSDIRLWRYT